MRTLFFALALTAAVAAPALWWARGVRPALEREAPVRMFGTADVKAANPFAGNSALKDFGVELKPAEMRRIKWSDFLLDYWPFLLPAVFVGAWLAVWLLPRRTKG